jgi:hypothetical protein
VNLPDLVDGGVPEAEGNDPKEVFAFFGLAAYCAQVLEQELILFASTLELSRRTGVVRSDVEALLETLDSRTLGRLISEARRLTKIPRDLDMSLDEALRLRNLLAHRFFERHSEDFISNAGRADMIRELRTSALAFKKVDKAVTALRGPLSRALGITEAQSRAEMDEMIERADVRDAKARAARG